MKSLLNKYRIKILVICYLTVLALIILQSTWNMKDINDTWILEGIVPLFAFFTVLYVGISTLSSNLKLVTVVTSVYVGTLNLIPQLKYAFLYGFFDSLPHYQFIQELTVLGHVPEAGYYAVQYGQTPGSHISISVWSVLSGASPLVAYKAFLVLTPLLIPLFVYVVLKKAQAPTDLSKIIIVSIAITSPILYKFTGRVGIFSLYLFLMLLSLLTLCLKKTTRSDLIMIFVIGAAVILSHDVTSFFVVVSLVFVMTIQYLTRSRSILINARKSFTFLTIILTALVFSHFLFASQFNFETIILLVRDSLFSLLRRKTPGAVGYYSGFYRLDLPGQIMVLMVRVGRDALSVLLFVLSPIAICKIKLGNNALRKYYQVLAIPAMAALLTFFMTELIRSRLVDRGLVYFAAFSPFFAGATIYWLVRFSKRFSSLITAIVLFGLLSISLIQFYPCQPLIPKIYTNNASYYVMDLRSANTIYQRSMVDFVNLYNQGYNIATDPMTTYLIYGLSEPQIQNLVTGENPLETSIRAQLILVSLDEDAQPIVSGAEAVEYFLGVANSTKIRSIIYSNGKSCIMWNLQH